MRVTYSLLFTASLALVASLSLTSAQEVSQQQVQHERADASTPQDDQGIFQRDPIEGDEAMAAREFFVENVARQAVNTSSSATSAAPVASSSSAASVALSGTMTSASLAAESTGGVVVITSDSCNRTDYLSPGQTASWTKDMAFSCCTNATASICYTRWQPNVNETIQCYFPNCQILLGDDDEAKAGFKPLSTPLGQGQWNNTFFITPVGAANTQVHFAGALTLGLVGLTALITAL